MKPNIKSSTRPIPKRVRHVLTPLDVGLGKKLRKLRKDAGMSFRDLQEVSGVAAGHLCLIEQGKNSPTATILFKICKTFNKDPNYFFPGGKK